MRACKVIVTGLDGTVHTVEVQAATLFEAASSAISAVRQEGSAAEALTPNVRLRVEVHPPPTVHEVTLKAIEQWRRSPTTSPRDYVLKRKVSREEKR